MTHMRLLQILLLAALLGFAAGTASAQSRLESPPSAPVSYAAPSLAWDQCISNGAGGCIVSTAALAEVQTYRASVFLNGVLWREYPAGICGPTVAPTPPTHYSCRVLLDGLAPKVPPENLTVVVWVPSSLGVPASVRLAQ